MIEFELSELGHLSETTQAFVTKEHTLTSIIGKDHPYFSIDKAIAGKSNFPLKTRSVLVEHLKQQYSSIIKDVNSPVMQNIELLNSKDTYTVCTGQQLHLFIGPSFVIYKILALIQLAEELRVSHPNLHFVPVYWLASEDHDFLEIQNTTLFKKNFAWETNQKGACGRFRVDSVNAVINQIKTEINLNADALALLEHYETFYKTSSSLAEATIKLIHHSFSEYGLVCIDADAAELKTLFIPQIKDDIISNVNVNVFNDNSKELESAGYKNQLHARAINFFYINQDGRNRIEFENNKYKILNTEIEFTKEELIADLESHPEAYSPNALCRPLYQECILPNICYVGGNAEINYWMQLSKLFKINNLSAPFLKLRPSVWITPVKIEQWLQKAEISPLKLLISQDETSLIKLLSSDADSIEPQIESFNTLRKNIQNTAAQANIPELSKYVEAGKVYEKSLKDLYKKILEIATEKQHNNLLKLKDIYSNYFDIKQIQERVNGSLELLIKHQNVVFSVKNQCNLSSGKGIVFSL